MSMNMELNQSYDEDAKEEEDCTYEETCRALVICKSCLCLLPKVLKEDLLQSSIFHTICYLHCPWQSMLHAIQWWKL